MKRCFILVALVMCGYFAVSQQVCDDMIITLEGNKIIFNCCIKRVIDGNIVLYSKDGQTLRVPAVAITRDGEYQELFAEEEILDERYAVGDDKKGLYNGHGYSYYRQLYEGSGNRKTFGLVIAIIGAGFEITGLVMSEEYNGSLYFNNTSKNFLRAGFVMVSVGVPLWISGAVRAANNEKAMDTFGNKHELSINVSAYGIGLVYRFSLE